MSLSRKSLGSILAGLLLLGTVLALGSGAAAAETTPTAIDLNETVEIDNQTQSTYVEATNVSTDLSVTVYGVAEDGTETEEATETISASSTEETILKEYSVNSTAYDSYRITVSGGEADSVDIGTIDQTSSLGGAGGLLDGDSPSLLQIGAVLALLLGAVVIARDS